jgi:hypothetical protein
MTTLDRQALIELVLWALQRDPEARTFGGLRREAEERVDAFLAPPPPGA